MFDIETKIGEIHFAPGIIDKIVLNAVNECNGKAILHNYKGKYAEVVPGIASKMNLYDERTGSIEFIQTEESFKLKIYIVIKFGSSIKKITSDIIDSIYENCEKMLGTKPEKVKIIVTGILSKNIAKRHIEVVK